LIFVRLISSPSIQFYSKNFAIHIKLRSRNIHQDKSYEIVEKSRVFVEKSCGFADKSRGFADKSCEIERYRALSSWGKKTYTATLSDSRLERMCRPGKKGTEPCSWEILPCKISQEQGSVPDVT
jgi:hypothetical protein